MIAAQPQVCSLPRWASVFETAAIAISTNRGYKGRAVIDAVVVVVISQVPSGEPALATRWTRLTRYSRTQPALPAGDAKQSKFSGVRAKPPGPFEFQAARFSRALLAR